MHKTILSTAEVARLFHVTETTVKRWADEGTLKCQKTPGGHRKFPMRNIVEFVNAHNFEPAGTLALDEGDLLAGKIEVAILSRNFDALRGAFIEKALSPDKSDLYRFFSYLYQHHLQLWEIYDLVLAPGMREIGDLWERGEIGICHEHHASNETLDALAKLQAQVLIKPATGDTVICACLDNELHDIGLRCGAYIFEAEGWRVHYLGARTPQDALIASIQEQKPRVVFISATTIGNEEECVRALKNIHTAAHLHRSRLLLGGRGATPSLEARAVWDMSFRSYEDLVQVIRGFPSAQAQEPTVP